MPDPVAVPAVRNAGPRLVFATGLIAGAVTLVRLSTGRAGMLGVNFHVYVLAAEAVLAGEPLYAVAAPGFPGLPWVYPPVVALAFVPATLVPWRVALALHTAGALAAGGALAWASLRLAERGGAALAPVDRALAVAFAAGTAPAATTLFFGNVNLHLAAALAAGALLVDRYPRAAGAAVALPAVVKVFPAAFGAWLLVRRAWREVAAAVATGLVALGVGVLAVGVDAHRTYVGEALLARRRLDAFAGGLHPDAAYVTLRRPLSLLVPTNPEWLAALAALSLGPPVAWVLVRAGDGPVDRLVALHTVVVGTLLFVPSYHVYVVFVLPSLVPLAYLLSGRARPVFLSGAALLGAPVTLGDVAPVLGERPGADVALVVLRPVLTAGTPLLYGALLTLVACALHVRASGERGGGSRP